MAILFSDNYMYNTSRQRKASNLSIISNLTKEIHYSSTNFIVVSSMACFVFYNNNEFSQNIEDGNIIETIFLDDY